MNPPDTRANTKDRSKEKRLADFLFEVGMLRKTPRTGYQFLGTGQENVAEHSYRVAVIGHVLALQAGADVCRTVLMCLYHDLHEARTGDFNYVARMYNTSDPDRAMRDSLGGSGLTREILPFWEELEASETMEAALAHDADQIDLLLNLKEQQDLGNPYAEKWIGGLLERLRTDQGRALAAGIREVDHTDWWFLGPDRNWWARKNGNDTKPEGGEG